MAKAKTSKLSLNVRQDETQAIMGISVIQIENGFIIKAGKSPVFFTTAEAAFEALLTEGPKAFAAHQAKRESKEANNG